MIRRISQLCKTFSNSISSKSIFDSSMAHFDIRTEQCPCCKSIGNCIKHAYYHRHLVDSADASSVRVLRVICKSCNHTHAILPDCIIPYRSYSLRFFLSVFADFYLHKFSISSICRKYLISWQLFKKWESLFLLHKSAFLGKLADMSTSICDFISNHIFNGVLSNFLCEFFMLTTRSFLQNHKELNAVSIRRYSG